MYHISMNSLNNYEDQPNQQTQQQASPQPDDVSGTKVKPSKKMKLGLIIWASVLTILIIVISIILLVNNNSNGNNGDESFKYLSQDINPELKDTYAFITTQSMDGSITISALNKNNEILKLVTTESNGWSDDIDNLFYSDGKIYFNNDAGKVDFVDLNKGNGNYAIEKTSQISNDNDWFYIKDNKMYDIKNDYLFVCSVEISEDQLSYNNNNCIYKNIDNKEDYELTINKEELFVDYNNVYIDDDMFVYLKSKDSGKIYKVDTPKIGQIYKENYDTVDSMSPTAHLVTIREILENPKYQISYEYDDDKTSVFVNSKEKEELGGSIPITLLPNDILMVQDFVWISFNEAKFFDLKTNQFIDNIFSFHPIYEKIWFVSSY